MDLITVNQSTCVKCGLCSNVCPSGVLSMNENGPIAIHPDNCITCGHCVAVCPSSSIDNIKTPLSNQLYLESFPIIDSSTAESFLRSRRSIRCYKEAKVPQQALLKLVNIARFAPTASNTQGLSYIVIKNKKILQQAASIVVEWMEDQLKNSPSPHWSFSRHVKNYREAGEDSILRNAPHIILATSTKDFKNGIKNTISAFSYLELFATTLGLGSCWAGLFEMCAFSNYKPLLELLQIPDNKVITGAVMVGYPKYKYRKIVDRNPLEVEFLD
ncbi:nitroreductase family protein [Clostridium beijerinckii]|uniref:4Fe-4S binding protein n=1 Tax=Clostridium beijerinckii TaxID=1520 RepID=A0AAW3WC21_CLOBE|nr:nitroreductase family protein [Clostridium beijerinckii]MBC2458852.1 4Fe-4S binding protein [Clostridium beijerinckii]MBC2476278.1 4Fe-4S binding protein [Clostridium beijerinckii]NOV61520.1 nitroreductase/NAD-dependent dihydropyrimidine dehydrogenase PreA subunit [Clostridium beijerinckii]NOV68985.1 nitroreductase/NAD-dependent dihydropyrimidine dehydrogenase PreA subunit [Clostridium beijerinckii]NOW32610.1 nitroreductase/NAD-dependent dihydropyrimidine dehydrogenase PreA subunit [Clostri